MSRIITKKSIENTIVIKNGKEVVRSDNLAKMFDRTHKQVLSLIRSKFKHIEASSNSLDTYFIEEKVSRPQGGGDYTRYYLTRKGFDYIALSLRGEKAEIYKIWYIDAFHEKQEILVKHKLIKEENKNEDMWLLFRNEGKEFRNKLTKAINDTVVKYRNEFEGKMNDGKYYYHYTQLIYKVLGISYPKGIEPRDVLDKRMLVRLEDMEDKVADMIKKCSDDGVHYKDAYKIIKEELLK